MTAKRFEVYDDGFSKHIEDTYYTEDKHEHNLYDIWEMCRKLNELHEKNGRLEEHNNKLMKQPLLFDVQTIPDTMEIMEVNSRLEKENEELKEEIKQIKDLIHTMLKQIDVEIVNSDNVLYSARIIFNRKEFNFIRENWTRS